MTLPNLFLCDCGSNIQGGLSYPLRQSKKYDSNFNSARENVATPTNSESNKYMPVPEDSKELQSEAVIGRNNFSI